VGFGIQDPIATLALSKKQRKGQEGRHKGPPLHFVVWMGYGRKVDVEGGRKGRQSFHP
jgi:hypothetical protein